MTGQETIWLVGMMGSGKTAVGAALARRLSIAFVDTDARVELRAGMSVAEIFAREGEEAFRQRERQAIDELAGQHVVAALGGGAIVQPGRAKGLAATGVVVYLRAQPETLARRVGSATERPLLAGLDEVGRVARLREMLAGRAAHYATASVAVDTDGLDVEAVVASVAASLREKT